jgi:hypothetical protein
MPNEFSKQLDKILAESFRGEAWIDDTGIEHGVDESDHASEALWSALGIDPEEHIEIQEFSIYPHHSLSSGAIEWLRSVGSPEDAIAYFAKGKDPRDWALEKLGWIRVVNDNFQVWGIDSAKLDRILDVAEQYREGDEDKPIRIEDLQSGNVFDIPYDALEDVSMNSLAIYR